MKFSDFIDVRDGTHESPKATDKGKKLITTKNLSTNHIDFSNAKNISVNDFNHINERSNVEKYDILLSMIGTVGNVYQEKNDNPDYAIKNLALLKFHGDELLSNWMNYYLQSEDGQNKIKQKLNGSTQQFISLKELRNLEIELPTKKEMETKSRPLNLIDGLIQKNNQLNDNLTNQIKYTSNNYFQFFKNHSCKNWTYVKLEDIAKISSGYSYQGNELLPSNTAMATIKNFNRTGGFNTNGFKEIKPKKNVKLEKYVNLFDVLVAHTDITQNGDIIGNAEVVLDTVKYKKIIYSMDLVKVTPKNHLISPFLLALLLQGNELKKYCLRYVNGTTVLHLNKKAIKKFEIPIPNNISDINNIEKYARYAYKNMSINLKENRILKSLKTEILNKYF